MPQTPQLIGMDRALIGTTLGGRYEIQRLMARGGMGRLYLAIQQPLGRAVVVKVMTPPQVLNTDPVALQTRFFREAATCARLQHPNTVTLFDYGELNLTETGETFYMVMEYIDGHNLDEELRTHGTIAPDRALNIAVQVARSLREAHGMGVVHRDLKPSNVMLTRGAEGEKVKVLDFGIAKVLSEVDEELTEELTRQGDIVGSPSYMSPEQVTHSSIDGRSDIYSLGAMLFHLISGRRPFRGRNAAMRMMAHVHRPTPSLRDVTEGTVPVVVDRLVRRCMSKDPADRYQNVDELIIAFEEALTQLAEMDLAAVRAVPEPPEDPTLFAAEQEEEPTVEQPILRVMLFSSALGLLGGLALIAVVIGGVWMWGLPAMEQAAAPVANESEAEPVQAPAVTAEVQIQSSPSGATVREGDVVLGQTPLTLITAENDAPRELQLSLDGHQPTTVQLQPGQQSMPVVELRARSTRPASPAPPPPPEPQDILMER